MNRLSGPPGESASVRVDVRDGRRAVSVTGVLGAGAVQAVCAAADDAIDRGEELLVDLTAVTMQEGDSLRALAHALRERGVALDVVASRGISADNADDH